MLVSGYEHTRFDLIARGPTPGRMRKQLESQPAENELATCHAFWRPREPWTTRCTRYAARCWSEGPTTSHREPGAMRWRLRFEPCRRVCLRWNSAIVISKYSDDSKRKGRELLKRGIRHAPRLSHSRMNVPRRISSKPSGQIHLGGRRRHSGACRTAFR